MIDERTRAALGRLTENERACLLRRLHHQTAKEMAIDLGISPHAVEKRLKMARTKLGVSSSLEAARLLEASEGYGHTGPQASDLGVAAQERQHSADPAMPRPAWRRIAPYVLTGAIAMSLAVIALIAVAPLNAPDGGVAPLPAGGTVLLQAQPRYRVQLLLSQGDKPIGSPKLLVAADRTARAAATGANGARYDITLSVAEQNGSTYFVKMDLTGRSANGRSIHVTPAALVKAGEPTDLTLGPADDPLRITLVVTPAGGAVSRQADAHPVIGSSITTLKDMKRESGEREVRPEMVKVSPELVRRYVNNTFDFRDRDHSGFIERSEAPEQAVQVNPVEHVGKVDYNKVSPFPDENEGVIVLKGPMGQAAYISLWDKDADGRVSRQEYMDGNFEKFLAWGVPASWLRMTQARKD